MEGTKVDELYKELEVILKGFASRHGLTYTKDSRITYSEDGMWFKAKFVEGSNVDINKKNYMENCGHYGLTVNDYGKEFTGLSGDVMRISGINTRARKYPVNAKRVSDGKGFKFNAEYVLERLGRKTVYNIQKIK